MSRSTLCHLSTYTPLLSCLAMLCTPAGTFAQEPPGPSRRHELYHPIALKDNVLTIDTLPDFRLEVADEFTFLGSTGFPLADRAEADVFLFAVRNGASIERVVKVQIESLTDDNANDYHWEGAKTLRVGDAEYLQGFWCFDAAQAVTDRPDSDTAKTQKWLANEGHRQEGIFVGTRLARVFAEGRSEILLFYGETTELTGVDCDDEEAAMKHLPAIVARSEAALTIAE